MGNVRRQHERRVPARFSDDADDRTAHDRLLGALGTAIGLLGAYTTFSTLSYETDRLLEDGAVGLAAANMLGSAAVGLLAV